MHGQLEVTVSASPKLRSSSAEATRASEYVAIVEAFQTRMRGLILRNKASISCYQRTLHCSRSAREY